MKKNNFLLYFCIGIFGILGVYLTFFVGNSNNYDRQTKAYRIDVNERYDSDDGTTYKPIYYFKVNGRNYECMAKVGSSSYPNESKNTVYYDSADPTKCKTEYEKSTGKVAGIICLIATAIMVYFFIIQKPSSSFDNYDEIKNMDTEERYQFEQEKTDQINRMIGKIQLIVKRVVIGIAIVILLLFILIDTVIVKQTIVSKDYPEVTAILVGRSDDSQSTVFDDYIYTFTDRQGRRQEVVVGVSKDKEPEQEIKLKYNENNPQDYYEEGATMDRTGIIWYIVKIVVLILLIVLFFSKNIIKFITV